MSYSHKFGVFEANLDEVRHPQSWRGHMRSFWETSLFHGARNMCTHFYPYSSSQVVHHCHLVLMWKTPPILGIICDIYWLLNMPPTFGQHMERPPKTSNVNPNKNILHAWSMRSLYVTLVRMVAGTTLHW